MRGSTRRWIVAAVAGASFCPAMSQEQDPLEARWSAVTRGTEAPSCSLSLSGFDGVAGLAARFVAIRGGGLRFDVFSNSQARPDGSKVRIDLAGATQPWLMSTEYHLEGADARATTLRDDLDRGRMPTITLARRASALVPVKMPMENWRAASSMFDACIRSMQGLQPGKIAGFTSLRHSIDESQDTCELSATYQLHDSGIWLVLTSARGKSSLKVTHRAFKSGNTLRSMDLTPFGGSKHSTAPDTTLSMGAAKFADMRRALVGPGVEFKISMSTKDVYTAPLGGRIARIEVAMFEACVEAKRAR